MELKEILKKLNASQQLKEILVRKDEEIERLKIQLKLTDQSQSEKLYQSVLNQIPDVIYRLDQNGRIVFISDSVMNYGYEAADLIGKDILDYVFPGDRQNAAYHLKERRTGSRSTTAFKVRLLSRTLSPGSSSEVYSPQTFFLDAEGLYLRTGIRSNRFLGTQGTARKAAGTSAFGQNTPELGKVLSMMVDSVVITDLQGRIEYVNPAFETRTGYTFDEIRGKNSRFLKSGLHDQNYYKTMWETIIQGQTWEGVIINKAKSGQLIYENSTLFPMMDASGNRTHFAAIKNDITSRKNLESQLLQSQKMEMLGQLAGGIAHDFNNYLTVINGYADMLVSEVDNQSPVYDKVLEIQKSAVQAQVLTRQLLSFGRSKSSGKKILSVNEAITDIQKMLARLIGEDIQLQADLYERDIFIEADTGQIEQIIINLVINARDSIHKKKQSALLNEILIKTDIGVPDGQMLANNPVLQKKQYVILTVTDTGTGIEEDVLNRMFDPFFTTKRPGKGTGLGLSTVDNIIKQNEGGIQVRSAVKKGSEFNVFLPLYKIGENRETPQPQISVKTDREYDKTIWVIEDDDYVRKFTETALEGLGYHVIGFENGTSALQEFGASPKNPDLIITDESLPGKQNALQRSALTDTVILYISGNKENELVKTGILGHGINFLQKPFSYKALIEKVRHILDRKSKK